MKDYKSKVEKNA